MDCQMPAMDRCKTTKHIRRMETENNSHILIVALTASATDGDRNKCLEAGMDTCLTKPIEQHLFLGTSATYLLQVHTQFFNNNNIKVTLSISTSHPIPPRNCC